MVDTNRPMRVLDKMIQGGLGRGNIGVISSRHGTGKVAVLTSIAIDHAMDGRNTLHVVVGKSVNDIRAYHDEVFEETVRSLGMTDAPDFLALERHKQIYAYRDGAFSMDRLRETLAFLKDHAEFVPELVEIQGWPDFEAGSVKDEVGGLKKLAKDFNCEVWFTAQTSREDELKDGLPTSVAEVSEMIDVIVVLEEDADHMNLRFIKTHGATPPSGVNLEFDPKTMLIRWR